MNETTTQLHPSFLTRMQHLLGPEYPAFLASFDAPRTYGLRLNTSKITSEAFEKLAPFSITPIPWVKNAYFYSEDIRPSRCPYYQSGLYYLQEPSAMTPASRIPIEPGDKVLDLCAAPGGKATAAGAALKGEGLLVANDISILPRQSPPAQPGTIRHPKHLRNQRNTRQTHQSIPGILRQNHPRCPMLR